MGLSTWELLIILVIVALLFGTKKLRNIGSDLGGAIKGFRSSIKEDESADTKSSSEEDAREENVIEGEMDTGNRDPGKKTDQ